MATNTTTTGNTPVVLRQCQHTALSSAACLCSVSVASHSAVRVLDGRYLLVRVAQVHGAEEVHGVERRGPIMSDFTGTTMSGGRAMTAHWSPTSSTLKSIDDQASDFGGHRGSDATDGNFSIRSGFRSSSPPV